ncbi:MAG: type I restriction endonuclease [Bacteroidota bacterium]
MKAELTEACLVEKSAIEWLKELGYFYIHGSELSPENGERESYRDIVLKKRFVKIVDFEDPEANEFLVSNQFTVEYEYGKGQYRRPDLVIFVNGIPLAVLEFKSFNQDETAKDAFYDHKMKIKDTPQLHAYSQVLVAREIVKELGYFIKVADWNRKEYIKARIRTSLKKMLMRAINGRGNYEDIEKLSSSIINHAEVMYAVA